MTLRLAFDRAVATRNLCRWFDYEHLSDALRKPSAICADTAQVMVDNLPDSAELTAGLRKLLEAKDCFVRATLSDKGGW